MMIGLWKNIMKLIMQVVGVFKSKPLTHTKLANTSFTSHKVEHEMV
jgi:uncharacterized membrane protein